MTAVEKTMPSHGDIAIPCAWQGDSFMIEGDPARRAGAERAAIYRTNRPFPHIVIDRFIDPKALDRLLDEFDAHRALNSKSFDRAQERFKTQIAPIESTSPFVRTFFAELNGANFLRFLEEMTGIEGLLPDPYFVGGGFHEIQRGGKLDVHSDFNINPQLKLVRRLNLLIYLNKDWAPEYGGDLELWDKSMRRCEVKVSPVFNRAVIFNTDLNSLHGHPDPLNCPEDRSRRSVALYYYTSPEEGLAKVTPRTTVFRARPGTKDETDWTVRLAHLGQDWVPPAIYRLWRRAVGKLRRATPKTGEK